MSKSTHKLDAQLQNLKSRGIALPRNAARARLEAGRYHKMARSDGDLQATVQAALGGVQNVEDIEQNTRLIRAMGRQRSASARMRKTGSANSSAAGDVFAAIPRFYDPIEYWDVTGLPWNTADEGHRHKLHKWLRLYYATHYLVPILIDIFTRFPLVGMELECKDPKLKKFYEEVFFEQLDYQEFLVQLGREYWTVGECFPMASFDESLGVWEREELINPEDVVIQNLPLLGTRHLKIVPPDYLIKLAQQKDPIKDYRQLEINFPELLPYLRKAEHIPISDVLLKQVANKQTSWDDHGTPILLRGLRTLIHEEKLLASQDAIAERLYSPLILAKLGILDLGDGQPPWVPGPEELDEFRDDMDLALSSDFRLLVHHVGLEIENVFGREQMPRLGEDFDRIERRLMQIFGVNPSLLSAGSNSQPYASSALQAEFMNQVLRTFQGYLKRHFRDRALVVAEAQEHFDYELRGQSRIPIMEEYEVTDEETGKKYYEQRNKLLVPELTFATLDLRDEATERQFLQTLRQMGVPISDKRLLVGVDFDIEDEVSSYNDELVVKTVSQQEAKMKTYKILHEKNLPIPPDLKAEVETALNPQGNPEQGGGASLPAQGSPGLMKGMPGPGGPEGAGGPGGGPGEGIVMPPPPPGVGGFAGGPEGGGGPGGNPLNAGGNNAPGISMERRPGMPSPMSSKNSNETLDKSKEGSSLPVDERRESVLRPRVEREGVIVERPIEAKKKKRYSMVDDPNIPDTETDVEPKSEST
jgi:hypothetical protein